MGEGASKETSERPRTMWQWVLVYPALAIALLTAVPDWVERFQAYMENVESDKLADYKARSAFIASNLDCLDAPYSFYERPDAVRVDGTICPSGDLMIRVETPQIAFLRGIRINDLVQKHLDMEAQADLGALGALFAAHAAGNPPYPRSRPADVLGDLGDGEPLTAEAAGLFEVAQTLAIVVCQKMVDKRMLLRHVKVGQSCYDETIDTYTGEIKDKAPVACRASC